MNTKNFCFPQNTINFLTKLSKNNSKVWFETNREKFNEDFLSPSLQFVIEMGERLSTLSPNINAIPKIDKSIFRLHRDIRFSKDKSPFKTNLGLYFWEGRGKKMECSGYYFHLEPKMFFVGAGMYMFTKEQLLNYRQIISKPETAKSLAGLISKLINKNNYKLGGKTFKKTPRGFDPDYKYNHLLLHSGLYLSYEKTSFNDLTKNHPVDFVFKIFKDLHPIHKWCVDNIAGQ
ncbi:MAG: DUF2461 domain-containing protein [Ignavibacteriales bacterium]|nr:DUF2461 domain-containing protein [Ignavibacteriales bacterium]